MKSKSNCKQTLLAFTIFFGFTKTVMAAVGIGVLANNLIEPVSVVYGFIASASIIIGVMCFFAGVIRYFQYRINPLANPISTVIVLIVLGIALVLLPLVYKLTDSGIAYSLF